MASYGAGGAIGCPFQCRRSQALSVAPGVHFSSGHLRRTSLPSALGVPISQREVPVDTVTTTFCGRRFSADELQLICSVVGRYPGLSRMELAHTVRELLQWTRPGGLKAGQCREFLELLDARGVLRLPAKHATKPVGARTSVPVSATGEPLVFRELVGPHHYLDHAVPFGAHRRYLIHSGQRVLGCLQFSSPAWRMAARDQWIGWDDEVRGPKLQQVVNNSRFTPVALGARGESGQCGALVGPAPGT